MSFSTSQAQIHPWQFWTSVSNTFFIDSITGYDPESQAKIIEVYPNPTTDNFNLKSNRPSEVLEVNLTDLQGRLIRKFDTWANSTVGIEIPDNIEAGMFLIRVRFRDGDYITTKVIKR